MKCKKKDCKYRAAFHKCLDYCDYIGHTGHSRGCDAENCDKYVKKAKRRAQQQTLIANQV